jgi:putative Mg2+ transporter-C (MgtC) family protein
MEHVLSSFSWNWSETLRDFLRVSLAFVIALPLAWERHRSERHLGLRTFPIVAMASCGFMLILKQEMSGNPDAYARLLQGLLTGMGFIGGGAILKQGHQVQGLATAASLWCTGAIGAAVAFEREEIALVLSAVTFATLRMFTPIAETERPPKGGSE